MSEVTRASYQLKIAWREFCAARLQYKAQRLVLKALELDPYVLDRVGFVYDDQARFRTGRPTAAEERHLPLPGERR